MALVGKTVRLQEDLWERVKSHSETNSLSLSESIAQLVTRSLQEPSGQAEPIPATPVPSCPDAASAPEESDIVGVLKATVDDLRRRLDVAAETERELRVIVAGQSAALASAATSRPDALQTRQGVDDGGEKKKKKGKKKKGSKKK